MTYHAPDAPELSEEERVRVAAFFPDMAEDDA